MIRFIYELIVPILIFAIILVAFTLLLYKKCPAGSMLVIYNNNADAFGNNIKIIKSGGAFIWPFGSSAVIFDLSPFSVNIDMEKIYDKNGNSIYLKLKLLLSISTFETEVQNAVERLSGLSKNQINELSKDLISGHLRSFFINTMIEETREREKISQSMLETLKTPLEEVGLKIMNLDIIEVRKI